MVHLDGVVADTRGSRIWGSSLSKRGAADSSICEALTEPLIELTVAEVDRTDSTANKRKETNINSGVA